MRILLTAFFLLNIALLQAQSQDLVKINNDPVDFSNPLNILLYIIFPILLAVFYIWWMRKQREEREQNK
ncbi:MAG: hypothetical protein EA358_01475 [Flavobacteriales bacterium]|jgi:H+/Cl- antiporter ClcA|nr:MAG: hypothetical protein EA358_01475 [Flavobacteriales bacterium]